MYEVVDYLVRWRGEVVGHVSLSDIDPDYIPFTLFDSVCVTVFFHNLVQLPFDEACSLVCRTDGEGLRGFVTEASVGYGAAIPIAGDGEVRLILSRFDKGNVAGLYSGSLFSLGVVTGGGTLHEFSDVPLGEVVSTAAGALRRDGLSYRGVRVEHGGGTGDFDRVYDILCGVRGVSDAWGFEVYCTPLSATSACFVSGLTGRVMYVSLDNSPRPGVLSPAVFPSFRAFVCDMIYLNDLPVLRRNPRTPYMCAETDYRGMSVLLLGK